MLDMLTLHSFPFVVIATNVYCCFLKVYVEKGKKSMIFSTETVDFPYSEVL